MYTKSLPRDGGGEPMQEYPAPVLAQQRFTSENATVSSVVTLTHNTTAIEIATVGGAAAMKWITQGDTQASIITIAGTTSNYDHIIPTGTVRRFVVPIETQGAQQGSAVGINRQNGLYQRIAYKSMGIASVLTSEY